MWIKHIGFTPLYLARANIACDVDENLRHDPDQRRDSEKFFFHSSSVLYFYGSYTI